MNETKDYYTFAEIITSLRSKYQVFWNLLKEMEKCLKVETDVTDADRINTQIEFISQEKESSTSYPCKIYVFVRKNTPLNEFLSQKIDKYVYDNYRYPTYPSSFILKEKDLDELSFEDDTEEIYRQESIKGIKITDPEKFQSLYARLKSTYLYNLPVIVIKINNFQMLSIEGSAIRLFNNDGGKKSLLIVYDGTTDSIKISRNAYWNPYFIEQLLNTKIPKFAVDIQIANLIEKEENKRKTISLDDKLKYHKESFRLDYTPKNSLHLVRQKNK